MSYQKPPESTYLGMPSPFKRLASGAKFAGCAICPRAADGPGWVGYYVNWPWSSYIQADIDKVVSLGFNTLRIIAPSSMVTDGSISRATLESRMAQALTYAQSKGLYVYVVVGAGPNLTPAASRSSWAAEAAALTSYVCQWPNVIAIDAMAEPEGGVGVGAFANNADFISYFNATYAPAVRAALPSGVPMTAALYSADMGGSLMTGIAGSLDFFGFHCYVPTYNRDLVSTLSAYPTYPIVIPEYGGNMTDTSVRRSTIASVNTLSQHPNVLGVSLWVIKGDGPTAADQFQLYDGSGAAEDGPSIDLATGASRTRRTGLVLLDPSTDVTMSTQGVSQDFTGGGGFVSLDSPANADILVVGDMSAPANAAAVMRIVATTANLGSEFDLDLTGGRSAIVYCNPGNNGVPMRATMAQAYQFSLPPTAITFQLLSGYAVGTGTITFVAANSRGVVRLEALA